MRNHRHALALALASLLLSPGSQAATLVVDTSADGTPQSDGACSLREAVISANNDSDSFGCVATGSYGADLIEIPLVGAIVLSGADGEDLSVSGDLDILDDLTITNTSGEVVTIDANGDDRVFDMISPGIDVTLNGLVITGGNASPSSNDQDGGGIWKNAGGTLTLNDCVVTGNTVKSSAANSVRGAGIFSSGDVVLNRTEVTANVALHTSTEGALAGGILITGAALTATDSRIADNSVTSDGIARGGGLYAEFGASLNMSRVEISGNKVLSETRSATGGGLMTVNSSVALRNATISGNSVTSNSSSNGQQAQSGGMRVDLGGSESLTINNSTLVDNSADAANGALVFAGGMNAGNPGTIELANSILANNLANSSDSDCLNGGSYTSLGYNIVKTSCGITAATGDQFGVDPLLAELADNGGLAVSTLDPRTHALLPGSPALDAGDPAAATGHPACEATDARGFARPQGGACDIGAYEVPPDLVFEDRFEL